MPLGFSIIGSTVTFDLFLRWATQGPLGPLVSDLNISRNCCLFTIKPQEVNVWPAGAYGAAVLYKKKDDDSLVILKEINMHDLKASERQMALNEVQAGIN